MRSLFLAPLLALGLALATPAHAGDDARFEEIATEVGLSAAQKSAVADILYKSRQARIDIKARLDRAELDLRHALTAPTLDEKAVRTALDAVSAATAELQRNRVEQIVAIRKQLSPEQWEKLKTVWHEERDEDEDDEDEEREGHGRR